MTSNFMMHRLAPLFLIAASAFGQYKTAPAGPPPSELNAGIASALQKDGVRILNGDKPLVELWFTTSLPSGPKTTEDAVTLANVPHGALLGAMRVVGSYSDRRGNPVKPGVYTLRFSYYPPNGDHQGVAPQRDFALISRAEDDKDAKANPDFKTLVAMSEKALGAPHPGVFSMHKVEGGDFKQGLAQAGETDWVLQQKIGDIPVAIILIGKAEG
jgi:hypothetical protein